MKLWHLKCLPHFGGSYDSYDSFIVAAETEEDARAIAAKNGGDEQDFGEYRYGGDRTPRNGWLAPTDTSCVELTMPTEAGVILGSFNAG